MVGLQHPVTPDGRYFVVRSRLWRLANPNLSPEARSALVSELMAARSAAVRSAKLAGDHAAEAAALSRGRCRETKARRTRSRVVDGRIARFEQAYGQEYALRGLAFGLENGRPA